MKNVQNPCPACPFSRAVAPGALGGSPISKYVGQIIGPFVLPCHKHCDFDDPQWREKSIETPQCAGAAIFRANLGVNKLLPPALHKMPEDRETVFGSLTEFVQHHLQCDHLTAIAYLVDHPPMDMLRRELSSKRVIHFEVKA